MQFVHKPYQAENNKNSCGVVRLKVNHQNDRPVLFMPWTLVFVLVFFPLKL